MIYNSNEYQKKFNKMSIYNVLIMLQRKKLQYKEKIMIENYNVFIIYI